MRILQNISLFSTLLPLVFFVIFQKKNNNKELRVIFFYILYCLFNDCLTWYLFVVMKFNAYLVYDMFNVVELAFFFIFFKQILKTKKIVRYLPFLFIGFIVFIVIIYLFKKNSQSFDSKIAGVEAILIIGLCLYYFYEELKGTNSLLIYTTTQFWIVIAILIYLSGTFFLFLLTENTLHDEYFQIQYIIINSSFIILKNILLSIALLIKPGEPNSNFHNENNMTEWNNIQSLKM